MNKTILHTAVFRRRSRLGRARFYRRSCRNRPNCAIRARLWHSRRDDLHPQRNNYKIVSNIKARFTASASNWAHHFRQHLAPHLL